MHLVFFWQAPISRLPCSTDWPSIQRQLGPLLANFCHFLAITMNWKATNLKAPLIQHYESSFQSNQQMTWMDIMFLKKVHTYLNVNWSPIPDICHGRRPCKYFLAGVNFYRFNAKNWHFRQILREKVAFFTDLTRKIGVFRCKFYSPKILPV